MVTLDAIYQNTKRMLEDMNWSQEQIDELVASVNRIMERKMNPKSNDETSSALVTHAADYSGGFIVFGGWTKFFDHTIPAGTRGHELYLAFGGLGVGGWCGDCDIEINCAGSYLHNGVRYFMPKNYYDKGNEWDSICSGFEWFHDNVKSFMYMYMPQFLQPIPVFVYFDKHSSSIGISVPSCNLSVGIGGGTVEVES